MRKFLVFLTILFLSLSVSAANPLDGKKFIFCGNSMLFYGGIVQNGDQRQEDDGMFAKMLRANGVNGFSVVDCTYGGHHLCDFSEEGCMFIKKHGINGKNPSGDCPGVGFDLLDGLDLSSFDYVIISESGDDFTHFYDDAEALFRRFTSVNPQAKLVYINHIYSVYKNHRNVLDKLRDLNEKLGVTIINCGQLACDVYTGIMPVPGGVLKYSDRYTFCNHTESDTFHPNPLMGYIMTQMLYCALADTDAVNSNYEALLHDCMYANGKVSFEDYTGRFYTESAKLPFLSVIGNPVEMLGLQKLIPDYIDNF